MADIVETPAPPDPDENVYWIWTIQLGQWRIPKELGIPMYDITVKSGDQDFSPTWSMLKALRSGELTEQQYADKYNSSIEWVKENKPEVWAKFLSTKNMAIGCYCKPGAFCHRLLFVDHLVRYLCENGKEVVKKGELIDKAQVIGTPSEEPPKFLLSSVKPGDDVDFDIPH